MDGSAKPRWYRRSWVVATATCLVGIGIGVAASPTDVTESPQYKKVATARDDAEAALADSKARVDELSTQMTQVEGDLPAREAAVKQQGEDLLQQAADLKKREKAVAAKEKSVSKREKDVGIVEKEIEANTISDGLYEVGVDIKAGTYKTKGNGDTCYWARLGSPSGDIKANNLGSGPSVVTVFKGDYLELNCGGAEWVLQR